MSRRLTLLAVVALAGLLRIHDLGGGYLLGDEYLQIYAALHSGGFSEFLSVLRGFPLHVLIDPLATYLISQCGGGLAWMRFPSVLWGTLAVWGLFQLGSFEKDWRRCALAAFLLSISLLHIDWSRRVDFYGLLAALCVFQTWALFRLMKEPRSWWVYGAGAALFFYSHPYAVLVALLHGLFLCWNGTEGRSALVSWARAWACAALLFLPFLFYLGRGQWGIAVDYESKGMLTLGAFLAQLPLFGAQTTDTIEGFEKWGAFPIVYGALYLVSLLSCLRGKSGAVTRFSHIALPFGIVGVAGLDLASGFYFSHRQLIWILPFYLIAVADGAAACLDWGLRRGAAFARAAGWSAAVSFAFLCFFPGYLKMIRLQSEILAKQKDTVERVGREVQEGDSFLFNDAALAQDFLYHYDLDAFRAVPGFRGFDEAGMNIRRAGVESELRMTEDLNSRACGSEWIFTGKIFDLYVYPPTRCSAKKALR